MKILWLYQYMPLYNFDCHLHMDFANVISCYPGVELWAYGPMIQEGYPGLSLIKYDPKRTMQELHDMFHFDVVIVNTKSRCFSFYNPKTGVEEGMWLPPGFAEWGTTKKIMMEEDYHYEKNDEWYFQMKFDLILQRHYSQSLRKDNVPMHFFPFSVDTATFNPHSEWSVHQGSALKLLPQHKRERKIAFIGNDADACYKYRHGCTEKLCREHLAISYAGSKKQNGHYVQALRQYVGYVACGSTYEICAAKNFEIIASGGILMTNLFEGIDLLFPPNCYVAYKNDHSDVVHNGRRLVYDFPYAKTVQEHGYKWLLDHHTHHIRIHELLQLCN